ncbi:MAG TPA: D-alanyl-D-alanine carboxypeptidase family protein [Acidimicrobiales bacterium]|jgi:D-alanyl-D-alanine carboxypeptidase|nr:D-alanyl-D-alanine carboxypeptidase family protein [Acidimicrobiales bacterium]
MRRLLVCLTALACLLLLVAPNAFALQHIHRAQVPPPPPSSGPTTAPPPPPPKAWILVDSDTGAVLEQGNAHEPLPPASVTKVLTALIATEQLKPGDDIPISAQAQGMPARNMNMKAGQVWKFEDVLHALLMVSANDAAVALAEKVSGSRQEFANVMAQTAQRIGMDDNPVLRDPAGLDDEFSNEGGNLLSAHDLAVAARNALDNDQIRAIASTQVYKFHGGDNNDHRLLNEDLLLKTYPGAIGMKTGWTRKAGHSFIGAATRDGRTMVSVVLGATDIYRTSTALLDKGFATPVSAEAGLEHLPAVVPAATVAEPAKAVPLQQTRTPAPSAMHVTTTDDTVRVVRDGVWIAVICLPVAFVGLRLITGRRRRRYLFR